MKEKTLKDDPYRCWRNRWYPFIEADQKIEPILDLQIIPHQNWIQTVRQALLLSTNELAERMNISRAAVSKMELNELKGSISIETLKRTAEALDCELIYVFRPKSKKLFSRLIWDVIVQNGPLSGERFFHQAATAFSRMKNLKIRRKNKWTRRRFYHDIRNQFLRKQKTMQAKLAK